MRILVVEDDPKIASFISMGLRQAGFSVDVADNGEDGLVRALDGAYGLAILDIMLPRLDGLSLLDQLRRRQVNTPVIILSAKRSVEDRIKGLQAGGDDYLTKPFSFSELLARVQALIRRAGAAPEATILQVEDLSLDKLTREVYRAERKIELQPREFSLLEYLMSNPGRVISKAMILEHVWDYNFDPQTNVVDVLICRLRNKIDRDFERKLIQTIRGVGYALGKD
ncbi:response regulator [Thiovibrio frasassiensis]|uniref:Response regulator transcription factor n=1 Tax=Thiovibrio frasassiensis TaxID=2984131 RepID=A0A9X4MGZ8_9BACT|nr:response regulator transcription factor [Thiovibrio frasassiensis]MDG4476070.1 response regulator transcription factor [Thiovibrio frasassiensis]